MIGLKTEIPLDKIERASLYINTGKKSMAAIKKELGCDHILNAGLFNMAKFTPVNWLVADGKILSQGGNPFGYSMWKNSIKFSYANDMGCPDFVGGYPCLIANGKQAFDKVPAGLEGDRGRSAIGMTNNSLILRCMPDVAGAADYTLFELTQDMFDLGCVNAINLDGGGSSQCDFDGQKITSSRTVHNYICVWMKKEGERLTATTFTNASKRQTVYETTACLKPIGSLDPYETATLLYADKTFAVVMYFITGKNERKAGFVRLDS